MNLLHRGAVAVLASLMFASCSGRQVTGEITASELKDHVSYLASDELAGRYIGTAGIRKAEAYIARQFADYGLKPLPGRKDYYLPFQLYTRGFEASGTALTIDAAEQTLSAELERDFVPFVFSPAGSREAEVVFAGYGITAGEYTYDDYDGLDVAGKIVLIMRHEPREDDPASPFRGTRTTKYSLFQSKLDNARAHGAIGMLLYTDPLHHHGPEDMRSTPPVRLAPSAGNGSGAVGQGSEGASGAGPFLSLHISQELAARIFADGGVPTDIGEIQRRIDNGRKPASINLSGVTASMSVVRETRDRVINVRDVGGYLPGSDPTLTDQWIVLGAHHDHLGSFSGTGDTIYNGADDNASGVATLLEIAQRFATDHPRPARSLVFLTFSAEEEGLLGSRALPADRLFDLDKVVFMLNLDMVGRNPEDPLHIYGDGFDEGVRSIIEHADQSYGLPLDFSGKQYEAFSDMDVFYRRDIPFIMFYTGEHADYHGTGDEAGKLSYGRMQTIGNLAYDALDSIADAPTAPAFSR